MVGFGLVAARLAVWVWAVGVRVSWDEYFFLFGTVYLHWGVVLNSPGVKCDNVIKGSKGVNIAILRAREVR